MPTSSQGINPLPGYEVTNLKISHQSNEGSGGAGANKVDVSTLALADGSERVYADAPLKEPGAAEEDDSGNTTTITVSYYGATAYPVGSKTMVMGVSVKCTASEVEYAVGEYVKGTATFVSTTPDEEPTP